METTKKGTATIVYFKKDTDMDNINSAAVCQQRCQTLAVLKENPSEENLWDCVVAFCGYTFHTLTGLPFSYTIKTGKNGNLTKELWIDRRESSKSLSWSSVLLAYGNIKKIGAVVERPKALGDIRGVSYIYGMFYRFGLIDMPNKSKQKI